jgi:hypothetical protein
MNRNGAQKRPVPRKSVRKPDPPSAKRNPIELPDGMWERIREKAFSLYQERNEGRALQDWLDAEEIVMEEIHEARE